MRVRFVAAVAVAVVIAGGVALAQNNGRQERPYKAEGQLTLLDVYAGPPFAATDSGQGTHIGRERGVSIWESPFLATGIIVAANGDKLFWETSDGSLYTFTGGTGRFEGATGSFHSTTSAPVETCDPLTGKCDWTYTFKSIGTITY
jgi:hypothetical protein